MAKRVLFPSHGGLRPLRFREEGRQLSALVPDQERFSLAREMILQRVYENGGGLAGRTVIDAGANVGLFSMVAAQHAEQVVALEPDPTNFRVLELNLESNRIQNVVALHAALWTNDGHVSFDTPEHEQHRFAVSTGAHIVADAPAARQVEAVSLETLVERYGHIDLLKIDIEGAEEQVLPATQALGEVSRIVGELHLTQPGQEQPMVHALQRAGFRTRVIPVASLYTPGWVRRVLANWNHLDDQLLVKLGVLAYLLAPVKPRRPGRDMPLLVATRPN